jgi:hypothetical protein
VYERLLERNDPSIGEIMRCVNEDLVYEFMQQFHGLSMPIDSIIDLLGAQLGSDMIPPAVISSTEVFDENNDGAVFLKAGIGASYHNPIINRPMSPKNAIPPKSEPVNTAKQALGGGFNTCQSPRKLDQSIHGGLVPLGKQRQSRFSQKFPSQELDQRQPNSARRGDQLEDVEDSEEFDGADSAKLSLDFCSTNTASIKVKMAMQAMKEQLTLESTLPSMHVIEKPLTTSMLHALGKRSITFEEVFKELDIKKKGKSSKEFGIKLLKSLMEKPSEPNVSVSSKHSQSRLLEMTDSIHSMQSKLSVDSRKDLSNPNLGVAASAGSPTNRVKSSSSVAGLSLSIDEGMQHHGNPKSGGLKSAVSTHSLLSAAEHSHHPPLRNSVVSRERGSAILSSAGNSAVQGGGEEPVASFSPDASRSRSRHDSHRASSHAVSRTNSLASTAALEVGCAGPGTNKKPLIALNSMHSQLEDFSRASTNTSSTRSLIQQRSQHSSSQYVTAMIEAYDAEAPVPKPHAPLGIKTRAYPSSEQWDRAPVPYSSLAEAAKISSGLGGVASSGGFGFVDRVRLAKGKIYKERLKSANKTTSRAQK